MTNTSSNNDHNKKISISTTHSTPKKDSQKSSKLKLSKTKSVNGDANFDFFKNKEKVLGHYKDDSTKASQNTKGLSPSKYISSTHSVDYQNKEEVRYATESILTKDLDIELRGENSKGTKERSSVILIERWRKFLKDKVSFEKEEEGEKYYNSSYSSSMERYLEKEALLHNLSYSPA